METKMNPDYKTLAAFLILTVGGGMAIGILNIPGQWYASLVKPLFNPPNWIFGPVWTVLYIMIAISGWMLWQNHRKSTAMKLWFLAISLNFLWSPAFFGMQNVGLALIIIIAMLASIIAFIATSRKLNTKIAALFLPYGAWVAFATLLNVSIFMLN
jgi:translocator protein